MKGNRLSLSNIILESIAELIIIFVAAAAGATIGLGGSLNEFEWFLALVMVIFAIYLKKISKL